MFKVIGGLAVLLLAGFLSAQQAVGQEIKYETRSFTHWTPNTVEYRVPVLPTVEYRSLPVLSSSRVGRSEDTSASEARNVLPYVRARRVVYRNAPFNNINVGGNFERNAPLFKVFSMTRNPNIQTSGGPGGRQGPFRRLLQRRFGGSSSPAQAAGDVNQSINLSSRGPNWGYRGPGNMKTHLLRDHMGDLARYGVTRAMVASAGPAQVQRYHNLAHNGR